MKLVVGGAGFIGSHLVDRLLSEDETVDVVDDLSSGSLANLAEARSSGGALKIHHLDAASAEADSLIGMRRPDVMFVVAGPPGADVMQHARSFDVVLHTLEAARRHGVGKVVVALPANALYGHPASRSLPAKEGEVGQVVPRGVRGVVARAIIDLLVSYRDLHAIEFSALALTTVYGTRQRRDGGVVAAFETAARSHTPPRLEGGGRQTRDLLYVDDAVDALARATDHGGGLVINVGTGVQTSVVELWDRVAALVADADSLVPQVAPGRLDELARFAVSPVRARIHLGWSPWTDLDAGLTQLMSAG